MSDNKYIINQQVMRDIVIDIKNIYLMHEGDVIKAGDDIKNLMFQLQALYPGFFEFNKHIFARSITLSGIIEENKEEMNELLIFLSNEI